MVEERLNNKYTLLNEIASGSFGVVWKAVNDQQQEVAIKRIPIHFQDNEVHWTNLQREIENLRLLDSPYVTKLLDEPFEDDDYYYLVLEYCNGGTLLDFVINNPPFSMEAIRDISSQLVTGIGKMHASNMAHRDLKLDNILLHTDPGSLPIIKLADLGLSKAFTGTAGTAVGSKGYCSPQILKSLTFTHKCDVWSFGVMLYQLAFKTFPFGTYNAYDINVDAGICYIPQTRDFSGNYIDLLRHCLQSQEANRYNIQQVMDHPFFHTPDDLPAHPITKFSVQEPL